MQFQKLPPRFDFVILILPIGVTTNRGILFSSAKDSSVIVFCNAQYVLMLLIQFNLMPQAMSQRHGERLLFVCHRGYPFVCPGTATSRARDTRARRLCRARRTPLYAACLQDCWAMDGQTPATQIISRSKRKLVNDQVPSAALFYVVARRRKMILCAGA